jgi:hypothetical protein
VKKKKKKGKKKKRKKVSKEAEENEEGIDQSSQPFQNQTWISNQPSPTRNRRQNG